MGLDMYLSKRTYVKNWNHDKDNNYSIIAKNNDEEIKHIKKSRITNIIEEVGYWRKDNHIHQWFVSNCQDGVDDCRDASVSKEELQELQQLCKQVKDYLDTCEKIYDEEHKEYYTIKVENEVMEETLPTQSGFFFGGTTYDRWYYESLDKTIDIINDSFEGTEEAEWEVSFEYSSSW